MAGVARNTVSKRIWLALVALTVTIGVLAMLPAGGQAAEAGPTAAGEAGGEAGISIVGGSESKFQKHRWLVEITLNGSHFCGGALVHPMLVLTAAHCLWSDQYEEYWGNLAPMQAFTGRTFASSGGEELQLAGWGVSSNYIPLNPGGTGGNDWGFLVLNSPSSRPRLKLAGPNERALWKPGQKALVAGWGDINEGGPGSPVLKQLTVPIQKDSVCSAKGSYDFGYNATVMLCAGILKGGASTCQGDSGGPLTVPVDGGGRRIVGVVSWGEGCARPNKPTIFTRVAAAGVSQQINALAKLIAQQASFPGQYAGVNIVGKGGKPVGCKKANQAVKKAQKRLKKARGKAKKKARQNLKKARKKAKKICNGN